MYLAAFGEGRFCLQGHLHLSAADPFGDIQGSLQIGHLFTQAILTLLKYILFLHISMNSLNDLSRAEFALSHMHTLVSWSCPAHLSRLKKWYGA